MTPDSEELLHLTLLGEAAVNADCLLFVADENGQIVASNDLLSEVTGLSRAELAKTRADRLELQGTEYRIETRVASQGYTLWIVVPEVSGHRHRRQSSP